MLFSKILGPASMKPYILFHMDMKFRVVMNRIIYKYTIWFVYVLLYFDSRKRRLIDPDALPRITSITGMDPVLNFRGHKFMKLFWNELHFYKINNFAKCGHVFYFILKWNNYFFYSIHNVNVPILKSALFLL